MKTTQTAASILKATARFLALAILMEFVFFGSTAFAASRTWSGAGANANWSTALNWDTVPVANDDLTFAGTTQLTNTNNITGGTTFTGITFTSTAGAFVLGGNKITLSGQVGNSSFNLQTLNMDIILSGQQTFSSTVGHGDILVGGILSGTGGFIKGGSGTTLILNKANIHTGESWLQNGSLQLNDVNALQNSALRFESTGSMVFGANGGAASTYNIGQLKGSSAVVTIAMGANTLSVGSNNFTYTYAGMLSGTGGFTKTGTGTLGLNNTGISYSGQLTVQNGTLSIASINNDSANGVLGNSALAVILGNTGSQTGTLAYTGGNASSTKKFTMGTGGTGAFDVSTTATTLTLSGTISGSGNLVKSGTGTLTVSGNSNNYGGTTTVSAGTLFVDGNQASANGAVNVQTTATLGGHGTIGGAVTVQNGGLLAPGNNNIGVLTVASLALNPTSTTQFEINGTGAPGTNYDQLVVTTGGALTLGGAFTIAFGNGSNMANTTAIKLFNFTTVASGDFTSLEATGYADYAGTWTRDGVNDAWFKNTGSQLLTFDEKTGNLTVVPEPSSAALLVIGSTFLLWPRRKAQEKRGQ